MRRSSLAFHTHTRHIFQSIATHVGYTHTHGDERSERSSLSHEGKKKKKNAGNHGFVYIYSRKEIDKSGRSQHTNVVNVPRNT